MLFEKRKRTYEGPANHSESTYSFLNRSAQPKFKEVRTRLNGWYNNYPNAHCSELKSRIQSGDNSLFYSAFFELYLHEFLKKLNYEIEIHPIVPGIKARPDFLVSSNEEEFYLEATCSEQVSSKEKAKNNIKRTVFDEINKIESDNFFLGVELRGEPTTQPSLKKVRRELKSKLKSLNPDDYQYANFKDLPKWTYKFGEWELEFFPIPKKPEARGKKSRVLGLMSPEAKFEDDYTPLKKTIQDKVYKYKKFQKPFLLAVNVLKYPLDEITIFDALLGKEQVKFNINNPQQHQLVRDNNGAFINKGGPTNTRLSAVILGESILPWSISDLGLTVVHHPWANIKYEGKLNSLPQYVPNDGKMEYKEGQKASSIILPELNA